MNAMALLFPGQGAQEVGMGKEAVDGCPEARRTFEEANEALGLELDKICFEGPAERLSRTDLCQPAILTVSVALLRAAEARTREPLDVVAAAGLSLGEYSALVAARSLDFADAVRLVRRRGQYMQEACDESCGTMHSIIGLEHGRVEDACEQVRGHGGEVWPANYNSPGQVVISGEKGAAAEAVALCEKAGARKVVELKVAGAFHSELMRPAAEKLTAELQQIEFKKPAFPVVSNVTGRPADASEDISDLLARQVTSPVRWCESMQHVIGLGAETFYEIGPGRVLCGLLRRIDGSVRCKTVGTLDDLQGMANRLGWEGTR